MVTDKGVRFEPRLYPTENAGENAIGKFLQCYIERILAPEQALGRQKDDADFRLSVQRQNLIIFAIAAAAAIMFALYGHWALAGEVLVIAPLMKDAGGSDGKAPR